MLDTHIFLWAALGSARLPRNVRDALESADVSVSVNVAAIWEISIKQGLGRLFFPVQESESIIMTSGFQLLPIIPAHAVAAGPLPHHHRDPFDRMLIAQAQTEEMTLVTCDPAMTSCDVRVLGLS